MCSDLPWAAGLLHAGYALQWGGHTNIFTSPLCEAEKLPMLLLHSGSCVGCFLVTTLYQLYKYGWLLFKSWRLLSQKMGKHIYNKNDLYLVPYSNHLSSHMGSPSLTLIQICFMEGLYYWKPHTSAVVSAIGTLDYTNLSPSPHSHWSPLVPFPLTALPRLSALGICSMSTNGWAKNSLKEMRCWGSLFKRHCRRSRHSCDSRGCLGSWKAKQMMGRWATGQIQRTVFRQ